jgi:hypothetical protein
MFISGLLPLAHGAALQMVSDLTAVDLGFADLSSLKLLWSSAEFYVAQLLWSGMAKEAVKCRDFQL